MAKEWGLLPSEIAARATSYDFMVMDILTTWDNYQQQKKKGVVDPSLYHLDQQQLTQMMEQLNGKQSS